MTGKKLPVEREAAGRYAAVILGLPNWVRRHIRLPGSWRAENLSGRRRGLPQACGQSEKGRATQEREPALAED